VDVLAKINLLDSVILLALLAGFAMGWYRGILRQLLGLAAFYVALVLGAQYHRTVAGWVMGIAPMANWVVVDAIAFIILFVLVLLLFNWVGYQVYTDTRIHFLRLLDGLIGSAFGAFTMMLEIIIGLSLLRFMVSVTWPGYDAMRQTLQTAMTGSFLEPIFLTAAPALYVLVRPWLPAGLPAIFSF
jgi:membrane protein required for colicin V production